MKPRKLDKIIDSYQFITKESADYQYRFVFVEKDSYPDLVSGNVFSLSTMRTLQKFRENEDWMNRYYYPVDVVIVLIAREIGRK